MAETFLGLLLSFPSPVPSVLTLALWPAHSLGLFFPLFPSMNHNSRFIRTFGAVCKKKQNKKQKKELPVPQCSHPVRANRKLQPCLVPQIQGNSAQSPIRAHIPFPHTSPLLLPNFMRQGGNLCSCRWSKADVQKPKPLQLKPPSSVGTHLLRVMGWGKRKDLDAEFWKIIALF